MTSRLNIVVLGGGGREHALVSACARSPRCGKLYAVPGNPGIAQKAECHALSVTDGATLAAFCEDRQIDLAIVGPEGPLAAGVADALRARGVAVFGPSGAGARLEASKEFSKNFMARHRIPTADFYVCRTMDEAEKALSHFSGPYIVKASGLAAGKGVFVEPTLDGAREAARQMLVGKKLGAAGETLVIEEALPGRELSLMVVTDGAAYLAEEKLDYRGVLYVGLMIAPDGTPKVLEYNVRLGDPETEVLLPLFEGDWVDLCWRVAHGDLASFPWQKETKNALCVILASAGYPAAASAAAEIHGLDAAGAVEGVTVFHAGTSAQDGKIMATGGRALCVAATGDTLRQARERAYEAVGKIHFQGMQYRKDIGHQVFAKNSSQGELR